MAIRTYKVTLDSKNTIAPDPVYLRQGDKTGAVVIDATLMDNGSPVSLSGLTPMFKANTADGQAVIAESTGFTVTDSANGNFTYQVPNALSAVPGKIKTAYFSLSDADGSESTFDVAFIIKAAVDISQGQAEDYITIIDGTLNSLHKQIEAMNTDIQTVLNAYNQGDFYNKSETDSKDGATLSSAKTYTDNSLSGIVALPETFANLAEIKAKYPSGKNGLMVAADNGHKYIWANNVWTDAGVYQSVGIAEKSITIDKLAGNAQQTIFTPSGDGLPNYDTTTQMLDFNCITDQAYFQVGNKIINLPLNSVVKSSLDITTTNKLIFNIDSNEFSFIAWSTIPKSSEMLLGTIRRNNESPTSAYYWQGSFDITIDGRQWNQSDIPARTIFAPGNGKKPNFDTTTRQFDFGSTAGTTPTIQMGTKVIPIPKGTIAYPTDGAMKANTLRVVYNVYNSTAQVVAWNEVLPPNTVIVCLVVYNYPVNPFISGGFPYTIDGNDPNLIQGNADYVPSMDGLPTFDVGTKILDLNCYTDQGYFVYNGKSYVVPLGTKIAATKFTTTKFTFRPSDMTFYAHAFTDDIPFGEVLFLSIRIGNHNNETVTTGMVPVDIIGQSFKLNATDNPIDAKIKGINHRGFNIVAPEESRSAYLLSKRNGYHHWEGDINWTKDNVPMMIHDLAINRTARNLDGSEISATTNLTDILYQDLANYDFGIVKGERFKGEPLLTFEELVKLARYNDVFLHIEFKYEFTQEQVQMLHNIVVKYNMLDRIGWQAFGWDWLKPMMNLEPNGQYELLSWGVTDDYFNKMAALKTNTNTIIASQYAAVSVDDVQKIADKGYPIYLWTVDDGDTVRKFRDIGMVEGIMTNGAINVADELAK